MKYTNPELISMLSAEYVLGTLHGQARQRFKKLMMIRPDIREAVLSWEEYFSVLNAGETPSEVPERVWGRVNKHLFSSKEVTEQKPFVWRRLAIFATMASVVLGGLLILNIMRFTEHENQSTYVSIFQDANNDAVWSVNIRPSERNVAITPINVPVLADGRDYELWLLPKEGQPISLGLLSETESKQVDINKLDFSDGVSLAVSLEPEGGSPTGLPTGKILYVAKVYPAS